MKMSFGTGLLALLWGLVAGGCSSEYLLTVTLEPQGVQEAGASWRVDDGDWRILHNPFLATRGKYTLSFKPVPCWKTPPPQEVEVSDSDLQIKATYEFLPPREKGVLGTCGTIHSLAFSHDSRYVALAGAHVIISDLATGQIMHRFRGQSSSIRAVAYDPTGALLASVSEDESLWIRNVFSGECVRQFTHATRVSRIAWLPNGNLLEVDNDSVRVRDADTGEHITVLDWPAGFDSMYDKVWDMSISDDGKRVIAVSRWQLGLWDVETGAPLASWGGRYADEPYYEVSAAAISPDGKYLAICANAETGCGLPDSIACPRIRILDVDVLINRGEAESVIAELSPGEENTGGVLSFTPDGQSIATRYRVWNIASGKEICAFPESSGPLMLTPDGTQAVLCSDGTAVLWSLARRAEERTLASDAPITALAFSKDNSRLWIARMNGTVQQWDMNSQSLTRQLEGLSGQTLAVSADETRLTVANTKGETRQWDADSGMLTRDITLSYAAAMDEVRCVAASPDGALAVTGHEDGMVRLWDLATGQRKAVLQAHTSWVNLATFSPDGQWVFTADPFHIHASETQVGSHVQAITTWNQAPAGHPEEFSWSVLVWLGISSDSANWRALTVDTTNPDGTDVCRVLGGSVGSGSSYREYFRIRSLCSMGEFLPNYALVCHDRTTELRMIADGKVLADLPGLGFVYKARFSADPSLFAVVVNDGLVILYDTPGE